MSANETNRIEEKGDVLPSITKRGRGRPRRIAPLKERESLQREINILKSDEAGESPEFSREVRKLISQEVQGDRSNLRQIQIMERTLRDSQPEPLSPYEVAQLEKEEKILIDEVRGMMVPKKFTQLKQYDGTTLNTDFRKAASEMAKTEFSKAYLEKAHRLKNIRRQLRPDDEDAGNLEFIRPD